MRLTISEFTKYYQHYKDNHDLELKMLLGGTTYEELERKSQEDEEWF